LYDALINAQPKAKRLKTPSLYTSNSRYIPDQSMKLSKEPTPQNTELYNHLQRDVSQISKNVTTIEQSIRSLKDEIVKEVCRELKGKVLQTWKEGTDRFYQDTAKSIISEYSRPQSVASDLSRSRSASRDFTISAQKKIKSGGEIYLG